MGVSQVKSFVQDVCSVHKHELAMCLTAMSASHAPACISILREVIIPVLGSPIHKRCWKTGQCPAEGFGGVPHTMHEVKQREVSLFMWKREEQAAGGGLISVVYRK